MTDVISILKAMGYTTVPASFYGNIAIWKSWYDGNVRNFHSFQVWNGLKHVDCRKHTMGMAKKVSEDWANLLLNEKVKITLEGTAEQEFFDGVCEANNFAVKANEMQELKAALGTAAYVVRASGVEVSAESGEIISGDGAAVRIDYVTAPNIFPLSWENGVVRECAFASAVAEHGKAYTYLQIHRLVEDGNYVIENRLYRDGAEASLTDVRALADVPPLVHTGSPLRQFVIDRLNIANNVDNTFPMGVAVFANAIDCLKGVDTAYDSYVNEFVLGKKRIMIKPAATKTLDGEPVFDENELIYHVLPEDTGDGEIIQPIDMKLRTEEHNAGLQDMLNALSSRCGFGENHYRFDHGSVATATQVISENSTMFRTIKKHEIILEDVLTELCRIILRMGNAIMGLGLKEDVEISIDFDDSIIEDKQTDFARDMQMLNAGIMNAWEFRARWMNEDEKTAKAALPKMEDMTDEEQDEVE